MNYNRMDISHFYLYRFLCGKFKVLDECFIRNCRSNSIELQNRRIIVRKGCTESLKSLIRLLYLNSVGDGYHSNFVVNFNHYTTTRE